MDLQTLSNLFATTLNPNPNVQKAGELEIRKIASQEGMIAASLQIIAADSVDLAIRQACAIWLKNRVQHSYGLESDTGRPDHKPIPPSDRTALKTHVLPLLANSPSKSITVQLAATLKTLVSHDFPEKWPELMDGAKHMLASSNIREVGAGTVVVLEMVKAFRFRQQSDILPKIVVELFPTLVTLASQMLSSPPAGAEAEIPAILHYILKTYRSSIILNLSAHQQSAESLVPWGRLLFQVVNLDIPAGAVPEDEDEREKSEWWKAKKWAYGVLGRLFHRYGNPSQLPSTMKEEYGTFAEHFVTAFAPEILKVYLQQTERYVSGQSWLSKKCQYLIFQFFTECVKPKATWALLKPHFETLVSTYVFPNLSFTPAKQEMWDTDPVDYVRTTVVDEYETYNSPVAASTTFLLQLANSRGQTTFMPILTFVNHVLNSNPAPPQRFGALNMIAALGPLIMRHEEVKDNMSQFMRQHVFPSFTAPEGYLRAIACEVLGTVERATIQWDNEENLINHFRAVCVCLDDPELPVRIQAALALTELITSHDSVKEAVAPQVGKVIQDLLKMCDDTDLDILNSSMETMVEQFQEELLPVAAQLAARLCDSYMRLAKEALAQEENIPKGTDLESAMEDTDEDKTYAAMGMAKTIGTLVSSVDSSAQILQQVQEVVIPIITFTLENKLLDLFDNMYDLVDGLTFRTKSISPNMWPVFEMTYTLFKSDAVDFLDEMLPALDNFVSYGTEMFKSRPDYRQMVADIYTTAIVSEQLGENDRVNGSKVAESLMLNLRGHIDDLLQPIVKTALDHIDSAETAAFRLANLEVLINAVLYNPAATLHLMEQYAPGTSRTFFDKWFAAINSDNKLPRVHDKRLTIVALCALMEVEPNAIPEAVREGWPGIVAGALKVFKDLPKAIAARKALEAEMREAAEEEEDDDEIITRALALNGDDDDIWDEDSAYIEMLAKENARLKSQGIGSSSAGDDEEDLEDDEIEEELGYLSPLDSVDPYVTFKHALNSLQAKNGQAYQLATTALDIEQQTLLMEVMRLAETQGNGNAVPV
ncbi:ARM repeat-containing protein [Stereum hirsutum FP-91666 SS1]|uniref:ARM repeat-containing protein n=1 Tax=Stereum hirsutum (strain FP-91666) TaxID=721885 RepID=UPI000444A73A|nr:ARM repeat-containing protein [Stereum hirsutum FP-91666 SS1]EIM81399.1 ARM repeat-containing protein [Stereum hirsutum FP-91666 SS1]